MNKLRTILSLALVALMSVPAYGAEAMQVEQPQGMVAKSKQAVSNAKKRALKQFEESVDRFKRCIRGKCTKMEALKVARDVTIAAGAAIAAMYVTGAGLKAGAVKAFDLGMVGEDSAMSVFGAGVRLQAPVRYPMARLQFPIGVKVISPFLFVGNRTVIGHHYTGLVQVKDDFGGSHYYHPSELKKVSK